MKHTPDSEFVFMYVLVPKSEMHKVRIPEGSYAKGLDWKLGEFLDIDNCKKIGHIVQTACNRVAKKLLPLYDNNVSPIIRSLT